MDLSSDADLLRAFGRGDAMAFETLYDRYDRRCFSFVLRMLGSQQIALAEDLHQEVWMAVAAHAAEFDSGRASFITWLFTIGGLILSYYAAALYIPLARTALRDGRAAREVSA